MTIIVTVVILDLVALLLAVRLAQRLLGVKGWGLPPDLGAA